MDELPATVQINIAAVPIKGFGGMCVVLASLVCAAILPETRWFMLSAAATGAMFGALLIALGHAR
jgi:hypothetical protein